MFFAILAMFSSCNAPLIIHSQLYIYVRSYTLVVLHILRDVQYILLDCLFKVSIVKDQQEHNWGEVAKYTDTKANHQALK